MKMSEEVVSPYLPLKSKTLRKVSLLVLSLVLITYQLPNTSELTQEQSERFRTGMTMPFGRTGRITYADGLDVTEESEEDRTWLTSYIRSLSKRYNLDYEYRSRIKKKSLTAYHHKGKKIYLADSETVVTFNPL